jgi:hypothetical protein
MGLSFQMTECMRGAHHFVDPALGDASDRALYFRIRWSGALAAVLNPLSPEFLRYQAQGVISVDGLTPGEVPCNGTLAVDYLREHKITYTLAFDRWRFVGEKVDVRLTRPVMLIKTHTTCYGRIEDEHGKIVSRSVVHFEPEDALGFLASTRVSWA